MTGHHHLHTRQSPGAVLLRCTCGWSCQVSRRQNALARAAKVRGAWARHLREAPVADYGRAGAEPPRTGNGGIAAAFWRGFDGAAAKYASGSLAEVAYRAGQMRRLREPGLSRK